MKIPVSWLKDFVDLENITVNRLCEALVSVGFEVEEVIELGREINTPTRTSLKYAGLT